MVFDEETPGWVRKTIVGGVALIAVLIALVVVLIVGLSGEDDRTPEAGDPQQSTGSGDGESSSTCGLPDGEQSIPETAPEATWTQVGNFTMPSNPAYGPGEVDGDERSCFARSPLGAVFSAMNEIEESGSPNPGGLQYAGFRITDYSPDRVEMELVLRLTRGPQAGEIFTIPTPAIWENGDWALAPEGQDVEPVVLPSMDGYVAFGPGGQ